MGLTSFLSSPSKHTISKRSERGDFEFLVFIILVISLLILFSHKRQFFFILFKIQVQDYSFHLTNIILFFIKKENIYIYIYNSFLDNWSHVQDQLGCWS